MRKKELHTGIYLLPNLFTTAGLFAAFYSIVASMKGHFDSAIIAIYSGLIADALDGRIARITHTQTAFGAEYDSLADMVTFGVAPSVLAYSYHLQTWGKIGWLLCFIYTAAVALRLARFNTQADIIDKSYFQGLASPAAAGMIAAFIWVAHQSHFHHPIFELITAVLMFVSAMLMVSNVRYYSFKGVDFKGKIPFLYLTFLIILFVAIAANPSIILLIGFLSYTLSGPIQTLIQLHRVRKNRKKKNSGKT